MEPISLEKKIYPDFKPTIGNCHEEPIHRPVAIQGHGHMMVFDHQVADSLYCMSDQIGNLLKTPEDVLWHQHPKDWMPKKMYEALKEMEEKDSWDAANTVPIEIDGKLFNIIRHVSNEKRFLEIEPSIGNNPNISTFSAIDQITQPFQQCNTTQELFQEATKQLKKITGYDRVMTYQFDEDEHGHVVGESKEADLYSYFDLHFPASDIPKMARDLFLLNKSRIISDIHLPNHWLLFNERTGNTKPYLDLSYAQLRATSPIHIEYLNNMNVQASMTLAITIKNQLWGLFVCHHYSPYFVPYELRKTCEIVATFFAQRLLEILHKTALKQEQTATQNEYDFLNGIQADTNINEQLLEKKTNLLKLINADGYAFITQNDKHYAYGLAPDLDELKSIRQWLINQNYLSVFATDNFQETTAGAVQTSKEIGGMLVINISEKGTNFLMWFRYSHERIINWGGDPENPYIEQKSNGKVVRISPRKSFEKWKAIKNCKSLPWQPFELSLAKRLHLGMIKKDSFQSSFSKLVQLKKEFEQLTYVASHDLQEPLRTTTSYLRLLKEEIALQHNEKANFLIQRSTLATGRMTSLVKDMLDYSRSGKVKDWEWVDLNHVLQDIQEDLSEAIANKKAEISIASLPQITGNLSEIRQLFQNLISNGIKYVAPDNTPKVSVEATFQNPNWLFSIQDNGIGINEKDFEKIFMIFKRLHRKDEYEGTGIGLAHCKKIVDQYDGKIWVESMPGTGSTFWIRIHKSYIKVII